MRVIPMHVGLWPNTVNVLVRERNRTAKVDDNCGEKWHDDESCDNTDIGSHDGHEGSPYRQSYKHEP